MKRKPHADDGFMWVNILNSYKLGEMTVSDEQWNLDRNVMRYVWEGDPQPFDPNFPMMDGVGATKAETHFRTYKDGGLGVFQTDWIGNKRRFVLGLRLTKEEAIKLAKWILKNQKHFE